MKPSLHKLVDDHFKPKWWQFWKKQKYHVCMHDMFRTWELRSREPRCVWGFAHPQTFHARVEFDKIIPMCDDGCQPILASDPQMFKKLDEFLKRDCVGPEF